MALQVTVNIQSNKIEAERDSFKYQVELNESNNWYASFSGIVESSPNIRYSNVDPNELIPVRRLIDDKIIFVEYGMLSHFLHVEVEDPVIENRISELETAIQDIQEMDGVQMSDLTWDNINSKPVEFPSEPHTHEISDVNGLMSVLDSKQPSGDYATKTELHDDLSGKVDKVEGKGLSPEEFTTAEKDKLAGLENPKFKGQFLSLADLTSADVGEVGGYAYVDGGEGGTVDLYIWDAVNSLWEVVAGESTAETPASIKSKYESNPDTNAFTDDFKSKLESMTSIFTTVLKTAYDNAVSWISANGANLLNHLSNKSNPHNVTASQVGLGNVDDTRDIDKPMSTATKNYIDSFMSKAWIPDYANMETTNRITSAGGGSWTSDRTGFIYVLSRGYNSGIYNTSVVYINEKEVGRVWVEATSGTGTARSGSFANIYPVKTGDVIKVYGNLEVKCLFIPGVWV